MRKQPGSLGAGLVQMAIGLGTMGALLYWAGRKAAPPKEPEKEKPLSYLDRSEPEPPKEPTALESVSRSMSLHAAIEALKPFMDDTEDGAVSESAIALGLWASDRMTWMSLGQKPDSRLAEALKDPDAYRGTKICVSGSVAEIKADRSVRPPVFQGGIVTNSADVVRFIAAGSTAGVVSGSAARFCGIFTGIQRYQNALGGTTEALFEVGMFDLPENRSPAAPTF